MFTRRITAAAGVRTERNRRARCVRPTLEVLEDRLAPTVGLTAAPVVPTADPFAHLAQSGALSPAGAPGQPAGFSPQQIRQAYGFNQITFQNGTIAGDGRGQTIAIVDAYDDPNIAGDLATFDATYGLPDPASFVQVNQYGGASYPAADQGWGLEISLDVEWAHAMAPGASILLVEASSNNYSDLLTAVNYARNQAGVSVVSMSWGGGEWSGENYYTSYFTTPAGHSGVTFVASTGDSGSSGAPEYPSVSPNVLAVGGTQLSTDSAGDYLDETGWSGSGGGISAYYSQPSYQQGVVTQTSSNRTVPDVSYNASSNSLYAVYDTSSYGGWLEVYGTSAGAPQWAALIAIANQGRALADEAPLDGPSQTLRQLYQLPASDFHDITSGSNGAYSAGPGYDLVTGRGSPVANAVVAGLIGAGQPLLITPANATPGAVSGTTTGLHVLAIDTNSAATLSYTWSVVSEPAGAPAPTFSVNGTSTAQNTTAQFYQAGNYVFQVLISDPGGPTITSDVSVAVSQTLTSVTVSPGSVTLATGGAQQFVATARDQFGNAMSTQPTWNWSVSGGGTISPTGLYLAPSGGGSATIQATGDGLTGTATVTIAVPVTPSPNPTPTPPPPNPVNSLWTLYWQYFELLLAQWQSWWSSILQTYYGG